MTKTKSLLEEINFSSEKIIKAIILPAFFVSMCTLFLISFYFMYNTSKVINTNFSKNFSYWLQVGDKFQIERTITNFNEENTSWHMTLKYGSYTYPEWDNNNKLIIPISFRVKVTANKNAEVLLRTNVPYLFIISVSFVFVFFAILVMLPFKKKVRAIIDEFSLPLKAFVNNMSTTSSLSIKNIETDFEFQELDTLSKSVYQMANRVRTQEKEIQTLENQEYVQEIISEISHDMQSPLAVQRILQNKLEKEISSEDLQILETTISRIEEITQRILHKHRAEIHLYKTEALKDIIDQKIKEHSKTKRLDFKIQKIRKTTISINKERFESIISNIINNSVEAIEESGKIEISSNINSGVFQIIVSDSGKGISEKNLSKLGTKGFTMGKKSGNGLGIYSAIKTLEFFNGNLAIQSKINEGTVITINVPIYAYQPNL